MAQNFTYQHLILDIYNSLKPETHAALHEALASDLELAAEHRQLLEAKELLHRFTPAGPPSHVMEGILEHASAELV